MAIFRISLKIKGELQNGLLNLFTYSPHKFSFSALSEVSTLAMAVCNCFLQAPPLSRLFLPVLSRRATTLSAGYGVLKSTVMFCSTGNRTSPLISPVRAEVKRVSRKDVEVASGK